MQKTKADRVRQLLTDIYAVDIMGEQPSNDIRVQFPLATDVEDDSDIVIVAADENNLVDETCLEVIPSKPERKGNTLSFDVSHFSMYVIAYAFFVLALLKIFSCCWPPNEN